jgi:hypothetical protein
MGETNHLDRQFAQQCTAAPIENGAKVILVCSNCKTPLVELWRTRPSAPVHTKVFATCAICKDKSFTKIVAGGFHIAPIENGKVKIINTEPGEATDENGVLTIPLKIITENNL